MAFPVLLLLLVVGTGTRATTTETTMEMETTETTTVEMTTETTSTTWLPNIYPKSTRGSRPQTSVIPYATAFPGTNTTNFQFGNRSMSNGTVVPVHSSPAIPHANATSNSSSWVPHFGTNGSSATPTTTHFGSAKGNGSTSAQVFPTQITSEGSTAPGQTPTRGGPNPSKTPAGIQLLVRVPLSFRIINRSFNESLRDPASEEYRSLSRTVLAMFEHVFGCTGCMGTQTYTGCSELRYSQGSVEVQSTLVFGNGSDAVTPDAAEQRLRKSLDQNGFIMGLQLDSIQTLLLSGSAAVTSPAPAPVIPDWAIALLVLVSILLLFTMFTCLLLMSTCTCRRKSRGKLDLLSQKDSYHPMAEYLQYQSHGRYVSPSSKPNPYSQVAGGSTTRAGTFTYTNPAAGSDNL
ncbi:mucin-1 [Lonchura striata]